MRLKTELSNNIKHKKTFILNYILNNLFLNYYAIIYKTFYISYKPKKYYKSSYT